MLFRTLLLFVTALLHEDVAILAAGVLMAEHRLPMGVLYAVVYVGVMVNNSAVYALGAAARRSPRLRSWLSGNKVDGWSRLLQRGLLPTLVLYRFLPGLLTPTLFSCGWLGIPFTRFLIVAALAAATYLALVLTLVLLLGESIVRAVRDNQWLLAPVFAIIAIAIYWKLRSYKPGFK